MLLAFHALTPERRIKALEIITRMHALTPSQVVE